MKNGDPLKDHPFVSSQTSSWQGCLGYNSDQFCIIDVCLSSLMFVSPHPRRWLGEDHSELPDDAMLDFSAQNVPVLNVQLVILEFVEAAETPGSAQDVFGFNTFQHTHTHVYIYIYTHYTHTLRILALKWEWF